jgi:hypothetical protein
MPPPSAAAIAAFEQAFGVSLPKDLVTLIQHANGGSPSLHGTPDGNHLVDHFYALGEDVGEMDTMWTETRRYRDVLAPEMIPFAGDCFGNVYVVDTSRTPAPVFLALHDQGFELEPVSPSLAGLIDTLVAFDEEDERWCDDQGRPPAAPEVLATLVEQPGSPLPADFLDLMAHHNGGVWWLEGWPITLWPADYLLEFNRVYESRGKPRDIFVFACRRGEPLYAFDTRPADARPVVDVPLWQPTWDKAVPVAPDFRSFMARMSDKFIESAEA